MGCLLAREQKDHEASCRGMVSARDCQCRANSTLRRQRLVVEAARPVREFNLKANHQQSLTAHQRSQALNSFIPTTMLTSRLPWKAWVWTWGRKRHANRMSGGVRMAWLSIQMHIQRAISSPMACGPILHSLLCQDLGDCSSARCAGRSRGNSHTEESRMVLVSSRRRTSISRSCLRTLIRQPIQKLRTSSDLTARLRCHCQQNTSRPWNCTTDRRSGRS
mmetsp:Transcript_130521/g.418497  ORF Transcript_130521/g.418497 Transcript_130521/m.418497 type:complete len:220 (+) Transcript_130521:320-979(+)